MTRRQRATPPLVAALTGVAVLFVVAPLVALSARLPWARAGELFADPSLHRSLRLSLVTSLTAVAIALVVGTPLAWTLARRRPRGARLIRALAVLPMVLPPVVGGVALLLAFGPDGIVGRWLPLDITGTPIAVVLAGAFVGLPFVVVTVEAGLRALDERFEDAAATLGADRGTVLWRVTLPLVAPSVAAGAALAWARALGEFGATITFAGDVPGRTRTLALVVYPLLSTDRGAAHLVSALLLVASVTVLVLVRWRELR